MTMNLGNGDSMKAVERYVNTTGRELSQSNTYIFYDGNVPHQKRIALRYRNIGLWQSGDIQAEIHHPEFSNPMCYYLHFGPEVDLPLHERFNAFIDARTVLAFLVHFEFDLHTSYIRTSWRNCIPERERGTEDYKPLWFSPLTAGFQTIWYTTLWPGQLYMERLRWVDDKRPIVEDHKMFDDVGWRVRELYE